MWPPRPGFYPPRREILPTAYPAMTIGDIGAAGGALALMLAADSFLKGYAPGPTAVCELASENGLRAAAVMARMTRRCFTSRPGSGGGRANRQAARQGWPG